MKDKELYWSYGEFGGNLLVNPKSTIEDQIFELINNALMEKNEPLLIEFNEDEIITKEVKDECEL